MHRLGQPGNRVGHEGQLARVAEHGVQIRRGSQLGPASVEDAASAGCDLDFTQVVALSPLPKLRSFANLELEGAPAHQSKRVRAAPARTGQSARVSNESACSQCVPFPGGASAGPYLPDVLRSGWVHEQLVPRDGDHAPGILQHPDLDLQVTPLLSQLAVNAFRLAERQCDFQTFGVHGHVAEGAQSQTQDDEADQRKARALSAPTRIQQGGCRLGRAAWRKRRSHEGSLSAARSFAERARGLRATSLAEAVITCLVRI